MADVSLGSFVLFLWPLTIVALGIGYQPIKRFHVFSAVERVGERPSVRPFLQELSPILIVIVFGLGLGEILSLSYPEFTVSKETGLVIALCLAIFLVWRINDLDLSRIWNIIADRTLLSMIYMVFTILIFKGILEDSHAVAAISTELAIMHIPLWVIAIVLPFMVGSVVGITIAFVGSTFPILIPLISSFNEMQFLLPYLMLSLVSGFVGVILSPLHLCLLLSNKYFGARLIDVYRHLCTPSAVILCAGIGYFWIAKTVLQYFHIYI